jgi:hypothetical protein
MPELKLARLPDRTPVKLAVAVTPELHGRLVGYAAAYREAYGRDEALADLIPAMLTAFLESDRAFSRRRIAS